MSPWFAGFEPLTLSLPDSVVHARVGGPRDAPALLLLHGFPQTHAMWHRVAMPLKDRFRLVIPDLRGYGQSVARRPDAGPGDPPHFPHSKRAMAADIVALLDHLGLGRVAVAGHDRGGRVAHRLALDHPDRVAKLCVIDIAPTLDMYARTDQAFATAYYHWFHLIQPAPLPETMIAGNARAYLHHKLGGWGGQGLGHIEPQALAEYQAAFENDRAIHSACEDYRASAGIDLTHDRASRAFGEKIACDTLVMWGERGIVHRLFEPLALWQAQCSAQVTGRLMPAGHFIPEELPEDTAQALAAWFV